MESTRPVEWNDEYLISENRRIYTDQQLGIPGLRMIGFHSMHNAAEPLVCHYHRNAVEITFVVKGSMNSSVGEQNYSLYGGDIFITPADVPHGTGNNPVGICEIYWVQLDLTQTGFLFLGAAWEGFLRQGLAGLGTTLLRDAKVSRQYLSEMFEALAADGAKERFYGLARFVQLLHMIVNRSSEVKGIVTPDIQSALDWIYGHLYEDIPLEQLSAVAGLSTSHFKHKFYEQTGMTPRLFINTQKVAYAKELLQDGWNITDVAYRMGFNSSNYFSSVFKKHTLLTPSEYSMKFSQGKHDEECDPNPPKRLQL